MKEPKGKAASQKGRQEETKSEVKSDLSVGDISDILKMLSAHDVVEFEFEKGEQKLWLKRAGASVAPTVQTQVVQTQAAPEPEVQKVAEPQQATAVVPVASAPEEKVEPAKAPVSGKEVTSPMVGTFYRRPAVDADPYVEVGDMVKKGDVLCIVEAMKIMNEIETDTAGRVVEVCLDDGQMVEYGEPMFRIEPTK